MFKKIKSWFYFQAVKKALKKQKIMHTAQKNSCTVSSDTFPAREEIMQFTQDLLNSLFGVDKQEKQ